MSNNIKTNMINEEWNKTQNDAPFFAFNDMCAVTFVQPDEMADVSIAGLQWFILIPRLNHMGSHRPIDSHSIPYLHREKKNNSTCSGPITPLIKLISIFTNFGTNWLIFVDATV